MKVLWIINKYLTGKEEQIYYPAFLKYTQEEMGKRGLQLYFVFFSDLLNETIQTKDSFFYDKKHYSNLTSKEINIEANRIERDYNFTFKQAYFPDILQTSKHQNERKISVPETEFNDLDHLIGRFLFLEDLICSQNIEVIFSDISPEAEMEFGRVIGYKNNKLVLKTYEGSALGRTVFLQHFLFGKDRLVEAVYNPNYNNNDAKNFIEDFIRKERLPYSFPQINVINYTLYKKIANRLRNKTIWSNIINIALILYRYLKRTTISIYLWYEEKILKRILQDKFDPHVPYLFLGFHLNTESTMALRALPYVNQTSLIESLSRVLPYGYYLYVREHPHWKRTFPASYLAQVKKCSNVRLISSDISIHEILKNAQAVLTYNATTGIESLIYGKPVLSFASNIYYKHHPAVDSCFDLFELGAKLSELVNKKVMKEDTYNYIQKLHLVSFEILLGAELFLSDEDAKDKADKFAQYFIDAIDWCKNNKLVNS